MKKLRLLLISLLLLLFFSSCSQLENLTKPTSLEIKASPKYCFSIGEIGYDLGFSKSTIIDGIRESGFECYEYNPDNSYPDELQLLMYKNVQDISINFSEMIKESGLNDFAEDISFEDQIEIPTIDLDETVDVDLKPVQESLNSLVHISGTTSSEKLSVTTSDNSEGNFVSMKYKSGYLVITTTKSFSQSETVSIIYNGKDVLSGKFKGDVCKLDLSGKTLYKQGMSIKFSPEKDSNVFFDGVVEDGSIVSVAEGLTLSNLKIAVEEVIDTKKSFDSFTTCTIGDGDLYIDVNVDESWKGYSIKYPVTLSGGINGKSKTYGSREVVSLNGATLLPEDTKMNSGVTINFKNGTFVYEKAPYFAVTNEIRKLSEVVTTVENINLSQEQSATVNDVLKLIDCGKSRIKCNYVNGLPSGNDPIKINFVSEFLGFNDTKDLKASNNNGSFYFTASKDSKISKITDNPVAKDEFDKIDFKTNIILPGSTVQNPEQIELHNVVPGKKYDFKFSIDSASDDAIDIKWNKVVLDTESFAKSGTEDTGFNPSSLLDQLDTYLKTIDGTGSRKYLQDVSFYLYCTKPSAKVFNDTKLKGKVKLEVKGKEGEYIAGSDSSFQTMGFSKYPDFSQKDDAGVIISDISRSSPTFEKNISSNLNGIDGEDTLSIAYEFEFVSGKNSEKEITITPSDVESGDQKLSIIVALVLPVRIGFDKPVYFDVMDQIGFSGDLLGRTEKSSKSVIDEYCEYLEYAMANLVIDEFPIVGENVTLDMNIFGDAKGYENKGIKRKISKGDEISIKISDASDLIKVYPLVPRVQLVIPAVSGDKGFVSISRKPEKISADIKLEIKADVEYSFDLGGN